MTVSASYYDGKTSKRYQVTLDVSDGMAQVRGEVEHLLTALSTERDVRTP